MMLDNAVILVLAVDGVVGIAFFVWYAIALSVLFPRFGSGRWRAWVPVVNEAEILHLGGFPYWTAVLLVVPVVNLVGIVLRAIAAHRIGAMLGRGTGATVLAVLLPPVWATLLAWGRRPQRPATAPVPVDPPAAPSSSPLAGWHEDAAPVATDPEPVTASLDPAQTETAERRPDLGWELELDDGLVYPISAPSVLLGRSPTGDDPALQYLAVRDLTRTLSKVHARLDRMGDDWRVIDLGSTNGVIVLDDDDTPHAVTAGADAVLAGRRFVLGHVAMRLQRTDADTDR